MIGALVSVMFIFSIQAVSQPDQNSIFNNNHVQVKNFDEQVIDMINQVNESLVSSYLEGLVSFGPRVPGSENCDEAAEYIYHEFEILGLDVYYDHFQFFLNNKTKILRFKTKNVVATLEGNDPLSDAIYILCAHYDTVSCSPGANDDGSGIATMLTVANFMSKYSFNHTVRFIAFSGHELGAYGSHNYVKRAYERNENIVGAIMLDMIGNTTKAGNVLQMSTTYRTEWISTFIQDISETYWDYVNIKVEQIPNLGGDSQSFLDYGYDAVTFIQPNCWEPPSHRPEDDLEHIVYPFLVNVTKLILAATVELAEKPINVQIRIVSPYEGCFYIRGHPLKLPQLNIWDSGLRAMTYLFGDTTFRVKISTDTDEEVNALYLGLDYNVKYWCCATEPTYEFLINESTFSSFPSIRYPLTGTHTLSVTVTTFSGNTAYDEMEIFVLFPTVW